MAKLILSDEDIDSFNKLYVTATERFNPYILIDNMSVGYIGLFVKIRIRKSISELEKCLSIIPNHINSMFWIGKCYQSLGDDNLSLEWFTKTSQISFSELTYEEDEAKYKRLIQYSLIEASVASAKINDFEGAIKYSEEVLENDPNNFSALGNLAMSYIIKGHDDVAEKTITMALAIEPKDFINNRIADFMIKLKEDSVIRPKVWNEFNI